MQELCFQHGQVNIQKTFLLKLHHGQLFTVFAVNIDIDGQSVELFDLTSKCETQLDAYPTDYVGKTMTTFGDEIVVCGGRTTDDIYQKDCHIFNPELGKWSFMPALNNAR